MKVGSLGDIVFTVQADTVKTLRDISTSYSANISTHTRHNMVGLTEHTGEAPVQMTFSIRISRYLNADPKEDEEKLHKYITDGTPLTFILGTERIGRYKWLLSKVKTSVKNTDRKGNPTDIDASITLIEYLKR